jgi:bifunctional non-homologous end joining protein LigD
VVSRPVVGRREASDAGGVSLAPLPSVGPLRPMLARVGTAPEVARGFAYEFKWDGARLLTEVDDAGTVTLRSRLGHDVTGRYPELASLGAAVGRPAVLDGEVVVLEPDGRPSFAALQSRLHLDPARAAAAARRRPVVLLLFDLLARDGQWWLDRPYEARRLALRELGLGGPRWQVPPSGTDLAAVLAIAQDRGLEGVVAKRLGSPYRPGERSADWVKLKLTVRQDVVVGGWRPGRGTADGRPGSLLVGVHDERGLRYAGGVGSGLTDEAARLLERRLRPREGSPFVDPVTHADARFVEPELVIAVRATEWTPAGRLRHPVLLGVHTDRDPATVRRDLVVRPIRQHNR